MATKAKGTQFFYGATGAEASTKLARVRAITPPNGTVAEIPMNHLESDAFERTAGIPNFEGGELVIEYEKAKHNTLKGLLGTDRAFKILYSDGSKDLWEGYISAVGVESLEIDGLVTTKIEVAVNGSVTFTPAA